MWEAVENAGGNLTGCLSIVSAGVDFGDDGGAQHRVLSQGFEFVQEIVVGYW